MMFWALLLPSLSLGFIVVFLLLKLDKMRRLDKYRINDKTYSQPNKNEIRNTVISLMIFFCIGIATGYAIDAGWSKVYVGKGESIIYLYVSPLIALLLHDLYFYLSHRILHAPGVFRRIHSWHHRSHNTHPWVAFSFHPIEAIVQIAIIPLLAFIMPINQYMLIGVATFILFMTVYGHSGYEFRAKKMNVLNVFNTSIHHDQHHKYVDYNFGIYLNIWDRLFNTNYPGYKATIREFIAKINNDS